ncbi:MAG: response regulator [Helicobacteraceae bacterium]|jgi:two-component system chemotaxis response regulator CheY|nr:response regulator [Helicobacteraceae bacterium]
MKLFKVVLVDDSREILELVRFALKPLIDSGAIVYEAREFPKEFLWDLLERKTYFDLLISDINMPEMNGFELIELIKMEQNFFHLPVLILTTESSNEMRERGRKAGVLGWVTKPFNMDRLRQIVKISLGLEEVCEENSTIIAP